MYTVKQIIHWLIISLIVFNINNTPAFPDSATDNKWEELLNREAFIYTIPKVNKPTVIDGIYVKKAVEQREIVPCRRCPDWLANPGVWRLNFNKGIYRIINTDTGWKSIGTYVVSKDRVLLANDPACIYEFGLYTFKIGGRHLRLKIIDDPCAIKLRALNLSETDWVSCHPPNEEATITDYWPRPDGCR